MEESAIINNPTEIEKTGGTVFLTQTLKNEPGFEPEDTKYHECGYLNNDPNENSTHTSERHTAVNQ